MGRLRERDTEKKRWREKERASGGRAVPGKKAGLHMRKRERQRKGDERNRLERERERRRDK